MKKFDNIEKDAAFLRANIATNEERIRLPGSLSEENIVDLVSGKKQRRNKKVIIRRFVGLAAAACLALGIFTALDYGVYAPKQLPVTENNGLAYAESYDDIVSIVKDYAKYKKAESIRYTASYNLAGSFYGFSKSAEADFAVPEMADSTVAYGTAAGGVFEETATMAAGAPEQNAAEAPAAPAPDSERAAETASVTSSAAATDDGVDFADTNTRVEGVGEADIVKTDGKYLYVVSRNSLIGIFKTEPDGSFALASAIDCSLDLEDDPDFYYMNLQEIYVAGDMLIAVGTYQGYPEEWPYGKLLTGFMVYDISDRAAPRLARRYFQDGVYVSCRVVGDSLLTISNYSIGTDFDHFTKEYVIPGVYTDGTENKELVNACDIAVVNTAKPDSYVMVGKASLSDLAKAPETTALFGGGCEVYCTADTLYVYNTEYNWDTAFTDMVWRSAVSAGDTKTTVLSFDITADKPAFKAKGTVEGYLLNSWSLDAYNGYLRLAATKNEENVVYVLDEQMEQVGELTGIAPGEIIKSVRFMGDTAYVVTFVQTDPLFVIDLSDPAKPVIKGEVKLPGFSSYLHPAGEGLLIGIGSGGTEDGIDGSAKISLFDVSDPTAPAETDSIVIPDAWFVPDYKAFVYVRADGSYLIPLDIHEIYQKDGLYTSVTGFTHYTGSVRIAIRDGKLVELNRYLTAEDGNYYWSTCERALYIGDVVYNVSTAPDIVSFDLTGGQELYRKSFEDEFVKLYQQNHNEDGVDHESMTAAEPPVVYNGDDAVMTSPAFKPSEEPETAVAYTTPEPDTAPIDGDADSLAPDAVPETEPPMTEVPSR
ncbi:MAG: beta-propeller domain-containing protein [Clostridia bacterium]|nr:beta-propeller domain-containing protein [Clostridia bacterium]